MQLVTVHTPGSGPVLAAVVDGQAVSLTAIDPALCANFASLAAAAAARGVWPAALVRVVLASHAAASAPRWPLAALDRSPDAAKPHLLDPVGPVEVWAAGVTYARSRDAREAESHGATIYDRVYSAERPEVFFKATGARLVGPNHPVGIRSDSTWQVPEAELGLVIDGLGRVVGVTAGNDMSSRDIEGENALYLPQAKIFKWSCAIGPTVLLLEGEQDVPFRINCTIARAGAVIWEAETSSGQLVRTWKTLVDTMRRCNELYAPTVLLTGTGVVPPDNVTLREGDVVRITVADVGTLTNPVVLLG